MAKCEMCDKGPQFGHNVSHSKVRTKRMWRPNVQKVTIIEGGRTRKLRICAKCLKALQRT